MVITTELIKEFANELANVLNTKLNTDIFKLVGEPKNSSNPFINNISFYLSEKNPNTHIQILVELGYEKDKGFILSIGDEGYTRWVGGLEFKSTWFRGLLKKLDKNSISETIQKYFGVYGIYKENYGLTLVKNANEKEINEFIKENDLSIRIFDINNPYDRSTKESFDLSKAINTSLFKDNEFYSIYAPEL